MTVIKGQSTCQPTLKKLSYKDRPVEARSPSFCVILWQLCEPQMWSVWAGIMRNSERRNGRPPLYGNLRPGFTPPLRLKACFQSHPAVLSRSLFIMVGGRWRVWWAWALFIVTCFSLVPNLTSGSITAWSQGVYNNYGTRRLDPHMPTSGTHVGLVLVCKMIH